MLFIVHILIIFQIVQRISCTAHLYQDAKDICEIKRSKYERLQEIYNIPPSGYDSVLNTDPISPSIENIKAQCLEEYQHLVKRTCKKKSFVDCLNKSTNEVAKANRCFPLAGICDRKAKYAPIGGYCNNLKYPNYGRSNSNYIHLLGARYEDGISQIRKSVSKKKKDLPSARFLGNVLFAHYVPFDEPDTNNVLGLFFGQFITHDIGDRNRYAIKGGSAPIRCCEEDYGGPLNPVKINPNCFPVEIPKNDEFFNETGIRCQNFIRMKTTLANDCKIAYLPANKKSSYLDLGPIYSDSEDTLIALRTKFDGQFKLGAKNILPEDSTGKFVAGDSRADQTPQLAIAHSIIYRLHNKIAQELAAVNKRWNDHKLFYESRRITIAIYQKIVYEEWLPLFIGKELCMSHGFIHESERDVYDEDVYDESIDPSASVEFSHNAFRVFHRSIPTSINLKEKVIKLSDLFFKAEIIKENDNYDDLLRSILSRGMLVNRPGYSPELRNKLFKVDDMGSDLFLADVMRSRDSGTAPFIDYYDFYHSKKIRNWNDLQPYFNELEFKLLRKQYDFVEDIDLIAGLTLEPRRKNELGPIGGAIVANQFYRLKHGDRFFWSHRNNPHKFNSDQLRQIKEYTFAKLLCWVTGFVKVPQRGLVAHADKTNPYVPCADLEQIDFNVFKA